MSKPASSAKTIPALTSCASSPKTLTKIINVPNLKEHQAAGVTGCLKNIAYGNYSNVDRSHRFEVTNTQTFIGTLAAAEPVRSQRGAQHHGRAARRLACGSVQREAKFRFYPKQMMFGTDPVAMDHKLIDVIEDKRKSEGAVSLWERSASHLGDNRDPNFNRYIREPGHVEYAAKLGLGRVRRRENQTEGDRAVMLLLLAAALPPCSGTADPIPRRAAGRGDPAHRGSRRAAWIAGRAFRESTRRRPRIRRPP